MRRADGGSGASGSTLVESGVVRSGVTSSGGARSGTSSSTDDTSTGSRASRVLGNTVELCNTALTSGLVFLVLDR